MAQVGVDEIGTVTRAALEAHGADADVAEAVARATAVAEARGNVICGLSYVESYCAALASGRVDGRAVPAVARPAPGVVRVDARQGFAQPAFAAGLPDALAAARANGIASLSVHGAHTCTSLGYFTAQIADAGLLGIGFTNASPVVAPPGGQEPVIGTNPIAFSVPGAPGIHFDAATSATALGTVKDAKAAGRPIPAGWAVDRDGQPTTDPAAALAGALLPMAGAKGWGFGVLSEVMAAGMAGGVASLDVAGLKSGEGPPHDLGQFYLLIDPAPHGGQLSARVERLSGAVAGQPGARLPGVAHPVRAEVEVPDALWEAVVALSRVSA